MPSIQESDPQIDALYNAWADAFKKGDVQGILPLLAPDYALWAAGAEPLGVDAMGQRLAAGFDAYEIHSRFECEERLISGDLAFDRGWDVQMHRPHSGGEFQTHRQRVFLILRRCADGVWRFARGMSQPMPSS
jgi:ketosteroid isomerase-like protein